MISFVGMSSRSSGKIRGLQISKSLNFKFFDSARVPIESLDNVVILIRNQAGDFARFLKSREHVVGYDLLDMPVGDLIFRNREVNLSNYIDDGIDFYIVNNSYQKLELEKHTNSKVFIIPHHTVNYENIRLCRGLDAKKFGYVGLPSQIDNALEIKSFIESMGGTFTLYNPKSREECVECFKEIDVGIVYLDRENKWFKDIVEQKPNTKLSNFQSFGIPTICTRYKSFEEFGSGANLFVNDFEQLKSAIQIIIEDDDLRQEISDRSYKNAQEYHISEIAKKYKSLLKDI